MGRGKGRGGERNKIFRLYNVEKCGCGKPCRRETKKSCVSDETNVEHRRKIVQGGFRNKSENV